MINTRLSSSLLEILAEGLTANSSVGTLDLSKNELGDKDSRMLAQLIRAEELFEEEDVKKNFRRHLERNRLLSHTGDESYNQVVGPGLYSGITAFNLSSNLLGDDFV